MNKNTNKGKIYQKINKLDNKIEEITAKQKKLEEKTRALEITRDTQIADDLQETVPGFNNSYLFTYKQVSERHNVSIRKVQKIVKQHGIERRNPKKSS